MDTASIFQKLRIGYVTAMWQRPELTKIIFQHVNRLREALAPDMELIPVVAGSEGEQSRNIAEDNGFLYVEVPNMPLSAKWNAALALLRDKEVDGVCIFGSDDLVNEKYFYCLRERLAQGEDLLGVDGMYFFDQLTGRLIDWEGYFPPREKETPGAGRFIHRRYLEALGWQLWPDNLVRYLDNGMRGRLKPFLGESTKASQINHRDTGVIVVDVKCDTGMTPFENLLGVSNVTFIGTPYRFFFKNFGKDLAESLFPPETPRLTGEDCSLQNLWNSTASSSSADDGQGTVYYTCDPYSILPLAHDFLMACRDAGKSVRVLPFLEWFRREMSERDILLAEPQSYALLGALKKRYRLILNVKEHEQGDVAVEKAREDFLYELPVTLLGLPPRSGAVARTLPLPFPQTRSLLSFGQRSNVLLCMGLCPQAVPILQAYICSDQHKAEYRLWALGEVNEDLQSSGVNFLARERVYLFRQIFRVSIFTRESFSVASSLLSTGTPAVCIGHPPAGQKSAQGVFYAESAEEAFYIAYMLHRRPAMWESASRGALKYAASQNAIFVKALEESLA